MGGLVQVVHGAMNVVDVASRQKVPAVVHPCIYRGVIGIGQNAITMRLNLAISDVDHGDLIHLDPKITGVIVNAENERAVVAYAEVIVRKVACHVSP